MPSDAANRKPVWAEPDASLPDFRRGAEGYRDDAPFSSDGASFVRVYNAAWRSASAWSRRVGVPLDIAEDALQDLAAEVASRYSRVPSVRTLIRLVRFRVTTRMQRMRRPRAPAPVPCEDALEHLLRSERRAMVRDSIDRLGAREQEVARQIGEGRSLREAAAEMSLGYEQVRRSLMKIHAALGPIVIEEK